jgi:hypothetical protein
MRSTDLVSLGAAVGASRFKGYVQLMRPAYTRHHHAIAASDVRWTRVSRLVTGE